MLLIFLSSCGRTPSNERFEKALNIKIPRNANVTKDEYQDMVQDYFIFYDIKLNSEELELVMKSIKDSKYNWIKTERGYSIKVESEDQRILYEASIDSLTGTMKFIESAD